MTHTRQKNYSIEETEKMDMDAYYNYQAQQTYALQNTVFLYSNFHLKRIEFERNVNLLNFLHLRLTIPAAQYAFKQEVEDIARREETEQLRKKSN